MVVLVVRCDSSGVLVVAGCTEKSRRRTRVSTVDDAEHDPPSTAVHLAGDGKSPAGANYLADIVRSPTEGRVVFQWFVL